MSNKKKSSGSGRMEHQDSRRPGYYDFGNGAGTMLSEGDQKRMQPGSGVKGFEWHPAGFGPDNRPFMKHHTYVDYYQGCKGCENLEEKRIHPNGSKPWED